MSITINLPACPPVLLASAMLFKPLFTAAMFALPASAHLAPSASAMFGSSASPSPNYLPSILDIIPDKNDAFLTGVVSTLLLATVSLYSLLLLRRI